jgi:flagellin-specific chaperone FliS
MYQEVELACGALKQNSVSLNKATRNRLIKMLYASKWKRPSRKKKMH